MGLKFRERQGCKGFSSFSAVFSTAEKSRVGQQASGLMSRPVP